MQTYKTLTTTAGAGTTNVNVALGTGSTDVVANAKLRFGSVSQTLNSLTIGAGSTVVFTSGVASGSFSEGGGGGKAPSLGGNAVVPEPGTLGLLLVGALGMITKPPVPSRLSEKVAWTLVQSSCPFRLKPKLHFS